MSDWEGLGRYQHFAPDDRDYDVDTGNALEPMDTRTGHFYGSRREPFLPRHRVCPVHLSDDEDAGDSDLCHELDSIGDLAVSGVIQD